MAYRLVLLTLCALLSLASFFHHGNGQQTCGPVAGGNCGNLCCNQFGYCGDDCYSCGPSCINGYGRCGGCDCFPASAMVTTRNGVTKPLAALSIGEEVTIQNHNGIVEYDSVYALAHADPNAISEFLVFTLSSLQNPNITQILQLTPHHFTIVQGPNSKLEYKVAMSVHIGDQMLANHDHHDFQFSIFIVSGIEKQTMRGLYKPLTLKGTIVVNNVLTSCFSQWYFHSTLEHIFGANALPSIYQVLFTPFRIAFRIMDKDVYTTFYSTMDMHSIHTLLSRSKNTVKGAFKLLMDIKLSHLA